MRTHTHKRTHTHALGRTHANSHALERACGERIEFALVHISLDADDDADADDDDVG